MIWQTMLVYLSKSDKIKDLEEIIKEFYLGSTAVFNLEKMEALPIGTKGYRESPIESRQMGGEGNKIPLDIKLINSELT